MNQFRELTANKHYQVIESDNKCSLVSTSGETLIPNTPAQIRLTSEHDHIALIISPIGKKAVHLLSNNKTGLYYSFFFFGGCQRGFFGLRKGEKRKDYADVFMSDARGIMTGIKFTCMIKEPENNCIIARDEETGKDIKFIQKPGALMTWDKT